MNATMNTQLYSPAKSVKNPSGTRAGTPDAAHFAECERNDDDDRGEEDDELQHVGHDHGTKAAERDVYHGEHPSIRMLDEKESRRPLQDDFGDRIEKEPVVKIEMKRKM